MEPSTPDDSGKQRRLDTLHQLAMTSTSVVPTAPIAQEPRRRPRWLIPLIVVLLIAVLAGSAYTILRRPAPTGHLPPAIPASLVIDLHATAHFDCPENVAWAPNGQQIAVLGDSCQNGQQAGQSPYIAVFDVRTGKKVMTFDLGSLFTGSGMLASTYDATWTPDGKSLVVTGALAAHNTATDQSVALMLLPLDESTHVFSMSSASIAPGTQQVIWNVDAGTLAATLKSALLPPALSYHWTADGHILPDSLLPTNEPAGAYSGRPTGASGFSYWQAGEVQSLWLNNGAAEQGPPLMQVYRSSQDEWSPDGQYLLFDAVEGTVLARTSTPLTARQCQSLAGVLASCTQAPVSLPDAGLGAALAMLQQFKPSFPGNSHVNVAWSPDGKLLAVIPPNDEFINQATPTQTFIELLSTASGNPVKQLRYVCKPASYADTPGANSNQGCNGDTPVWSPTGQQIALLDTGTMQLALLKV